MAEAPVAEGKPRLYSYWRSSCSHRARIVHNLKGVDYVYKSVNLLKGEQSDPEFMKLNPIKFVPALVDGDAVIGDSNAITMYLEDKYPERPLLPQDLKKKALSIQIASIVCSGIQPLHNLTLLRFIEQKVGTGEGLPWTQQQIDRGFTAHISKGSVNGLAHITGGGFTDNIPGVFPSGLGVKFFIGSWEAPPVFMWIQQVGKIEDAKMRRTFNMGVGMVLIVSKEASDRILEDTHGSNHAYRIGEVI